MPMPGSYASMAMKCVAQMPLPAATPAAMIQLARADCARGPGVVEEIDRDQARKKADEPGQDDQSPIVLGGEAVKDTEHGWHRWLEAFSGVMSILPPAAASPEPGIPVALIALERAVERTYPDTRCVGVNAGLPKS